MCGGNNMILVYDQNHYFGPITKPKPKLAGTFGWYQTSWLEALYKIASRGWHVEILQIVS